jgi:serine/threonine protein kinase
MEYLDGCTLAEVLGEESRLPLEWAVDILEQVCSAVDEAHQQGLVHRDLKPDNIWLEPNRLGGYRIKVLDFGIAKLADVTANESQDGADTHQPPAGSEPDQSAVSNPQNQSFLPSDVDGSEAATRMFPAIRPSEADTRIFATSRTRPPGGEAAEAAGGLGTFARVGVDTQPPESEFASNTGSAVEVTRVGAILGTPLYMSPEQCRGKQLDARSDIYSLGVVAYQMLAGQTPFTGDTIRVMEMHARDAPPSLRARNTKVPKKVAQLIDSALAKNPDDRPASAAAFGAALRASSEGADTLLRRSFALYSERFPTFLRISIFAYAPVIVFAVVMLILESLERLNVIPRLAAIITTAATGVLYGMASAVAASVIAGVTVLIVMQLSVAPLRPVELRPAFALLRKRWWPFLRSTVRIFLTIILGFALFVIPGFIFMVRYALYAPVVLVEGLQGRAVLTRAVELMRRSKRTVVLIVLVQMSIPFLVSLITGTKSAPREIHAVTGSGAFNVTVSAAINILLSLAISIILSPLFSIMTALLYLKARRMGGEEVRESSDYFAEQDMPRSKWQMRMRERLSLQTRTVR